MNMRKNKCAIKKRDKYPQLTKKNGEEYATGAEQSGVKSNENYKYGQKKFIKEEWDQKPHLQKISRHLGLRWPTR